MERILDDSDEVKKVPNAERVLQVIEGLPEDCEEAIENARSYLKKVKFGIDPKRLNHVVICGMGGSGINGSFLKDWLRSRVEYSIEVVKGYKLPAYANKDTLVVAISYSGKTEETLECFKQAIKEECKCIGIASGGDLIELCKEKGVPFIEVTRKYEKDSRYGVGVLLFTLTEIFRELKLIGEYGSEIDEAVKILKELREKLKVGVGTDSNLAKQLATRIGGFTPYIYSFPPFESAGIRMGNEFQENSKTHSIFVQVPEGCHNAIVAWESEESKSFFVIIPRDTEEEYNIPTRLDHMKEVALEKIPKEQLFEFDLSWDNLLQNKPKGRLAKLMSFVYFGTYSSVYLGILKGVDPKDIGSIWKLKDKLAKK